MAEFEAIIIWASAIGSQPSRGAVLHIGASCVAECRVRIDLAQLPTRHLFGPTTGTARGFALGEDRGLGSLLDAAEKIAGDRFEKLALDAASAPVPVPQSLENRIATSIDDGVENTGRTRLALCRG
ncbi:hypothetical protein ACVWZZ_001429 [Bradyrhizobium sp. LM6.10]